MSRGTIYLLHFARPFKHARHYLGYTPRPLQGRLADHGGPRGANLLRHVKAAGIDWELARTWHGDRTDERRLKNRHSGVRLCPICRAAPPDPPCPHDDPLEARS